jgi:hypothetical protein
MSKPGARDHYAKDDKEVRLHAEVVRGALNITWQDFVRIHYDLTIIYASQDKIIRSMCADRVLAVGTRTYGSGISFDAVLDAMCARSLHTCRDMVNKGRLDNDGTYTKEAFDFWEMELEEARKRDQSSNVISSGMKRSYAGENQEDAESTPKRTKLEESKKRGHQEHGSGDDEPVSERRRFPESLKRSRDTENSNDDPRAFKQQKVAY